MALLNRRYLFIHMAAGEVATSRRTLNRYLVHLAFRIICNVMTLQGHSTEEITGSQSTPNTSALEPHHFP